MKGEINQLYKILYPNGKATTTEEQLKQLPKGDDKIFEEAMQAATPEQQELIKNIQQSSQKIQGPHNKQWLDNFVIEDLCKQFERNSTENYHFMGISLYDDFQYALTDTQNNLSPIKIVQYIKKYAHEQIKDQQPDIVDKQIKESSEKNKIKLGYVINTCHKYSSGQHWVAMGIIYYYSSNSLQVQYYDSQGSTGYIKHNETLNCPCNDDCPLDYLKYHPHCEDWEKLLMKTLKTHLNLKSSHYSFQHNLQYTQNDQYSCGYHACLYNYFLSVTDKPINYINIMITQYTKNGDVLDDAIKVIQDTFFAKETPLDDPCQNISGGAVDIKIVTASTF